MKIRPWLIPVVSLTGLLVPSPAGSRVAAERRVVVFYTGAVLGTLEPCGCTSDPLGDFARMTAIVRRAQKEHAGVLLVDGGNLSYAGAEVSEGRRDGADLRAAFLARELARLPFAGSALGEADIARGKDRVSPRRLAANLSASALVQPARVHQVGGVRVGVLGLADPAAALSHGLRVEDPVTAAKRDAAALRSAGAEVVVLLAPLERPLARQVARAGGIDFVVLGKNTGDGLPRAERVGDAYLIAPAVELQNLGRLEIVLRDGGGPVADAGGAESERLRGQEIDRMVRDLNVQLSAWQKDRSADAAFVAAKRKERDALEVERSRLGSGPWQPPAQGSYFTNQLIPLRRALPRDSALAASMRMLDRAVGAANLRHVQPPPKAEPGRAHFVGDKACVRCHREEMAFWKTTVHAKAWRTLVVGSKTGHDDCVSCHVTGFGEVGGSALGFTRGLESVQCETCHGPGSRHVAEDGLEEPMAVKLQTPEATCVRCHNEKHSDTFAYVPYLRDVLGPGHGAQARKQLGDGPTGKQLRGAAIAKARAAGASQTKASH